MDKIYAFTGYKKSELIISLASWALTAGEQGGTEDARMLTAILIHIARDNQ